MNDKANILSKATGTFRTSALDEQLPRVGDRIGDSQIERVLGQGAIGRVYLTYNPQLDVRRAVKMLFPGFTKDNVHRLREEAKIYAKLDFPNIVRMHSIGTWEHELPYIEMEYINGPTLEFLIEKYKRLPQPVALSVAIMVCLALDYAQKITFSIDGALKVGITHRDIKPANILFTSSGEVKLVDFGLARIGHISTYTKETQTPGSFPYMSPEQHDCNLDRINHKSDMYSLGIVLYEMMNGKRPFPEDGIDIQVNAKKKENYAALKSKVPDTLESVDTLIRKTLKAEQDKRWDRYGALIMALKSALGELTGRSPASILQDYIRDPEHFRFVAAPQGKNKKSIRRLVASLILAAVIAGIGFVALKTTHLQNAQQKNVTQTVPVVVATPVPPPVIQPVETTTSLTVADTVMSQQVTAKETNKKPPVVAPLITMSFSQRLKQAAAARTSNNWPLVVRSLAGVSPSEQSKTARDSATMLLLEAYCMQNDFNNAAAILGADREIFDAQYYLYAGIFYTNLSEYAKARDALDKSVHMPTVMGAGVKAKAWLWRARFLENSLDASIPEQKLVMQNGWKDYLKNVCQSGKGTTADCEHAKSYQGTP